MMTEHIIHIDDLSPPASRLGTLEGGPGNAVNAQSTHRRPA